MNLKIQSIFGIAALLLTACATGEEADPLPGEEECTPYCVDSNFLMSCTPAGQVLVNCANGCANGACSSLDPVTPDPGTPSAGECSHTGEQCVQGNMVTCVFGKITNSTHCANGCEDGATACNLLPPSTPTEPDPVTPSTPECTHQGSICLDGSLVTCASGKITGKTSCANGCTNGASACNAAPTPECNHQGTLCIDNVLVTCASGIITAKTPCDNGCNAGAKSCNTKPTTDPSLPTVGASCDVNTFEYVCQKGQFFYCKSGKITSFSCSGDNITCAQFKGKDDCVYILDNPTEGKVYEHEETCSLYAKYASESGRNPADFVVATKADDGKIYGVETVAMSFCSENYTVYCMNGEMKAAECGIACSYIPGDDEYYGYAECTLPNANQACSSKQTANCKSKNAELPLCYIDKAYGEVNCTSSCDEPESSTYCADLDAYSASVNYACESISDNLMLTFDYSTYKKCASKCNASHTACK